MLWNAKSKSEGFCVVRPTEFFGKFAPFNCARVKSVHPPFDSQAGVWSIDPSANQPLSVRASAPVRQPPARVFA